MASNNRLMNQPPSMVLVDFELSSMLNYVVRVSGAIGWDISHLYAVKDYDRLSSQYRCENDEEIISQIHVKNPNLVYLWDFSVGEQSGFVEQIREVYSGPIVAAGRDELVKASDYSLDAYFAWPIDGDKMEKMLEEMYVLATSTGRDDAALRGYLAAITE